ncbi:MAG: phytoene desaturase family protein [Terriglobales bacterium]
MPANRDIVIAGGGHNGLVAAFYLAKAGYKTVVLERRDVVGGAAITDEFYPGFRCSTLAHMTAPLQARIIRDMGLARHGLKMMQPEVRVFAPAREGRALVLYGDIEKSRAEISRFSAKDGRNYLEFQKSLASLADVIADLLPVTPPDMDHPSASDLWSLLKTGKKARGLGRRELYQLLRWGPMPVADLIAEWFDTELLRAVIAARGIFGTALGPRSAGSAMMLMLRTACDGEACGSAWFAEGGMGEVTQAMAAACREAGVEIRTGASVAQIRVKDGSATGVVLDSGEEIAARTVVSNTDPKATLLRLVDAQHLEPSFLEKLSNFRTHGMLSKVNIALSGLPKFAGATEEDALRGRIHIGPEIDYLERAFDASKYGQFPEKPYLEAVIPTLMDSTLAPPGKHVMSVYVQFTPYQLRGRDWNSQRDKFGDTVIKTLAEYAPDLPSMILGYQVITPKDLETTYGMTGGHPFHGELSLDQFFTMRPLLDWARYRTPIKGLYLCGSGTHPGIGLSGMSGANAAREAGRDLKR